MKMVDINEKFTSLVSEYIAKGYVINPRTMSGHQGEVCKVDFLKGNEFIRIWMLEEYDYDWDNPKHYNEKKMVVRVCTYNKEFNNLGTVWESDLDTIEEYVYYCLDRRSDWYTDSLEEALDVQELRHQRWKKNHFRNDKDTYYHDEAHQLIAVKYLKRKIGYKRVSMEHASITKKVHKGKTTYYVHYRQDSYLVR